MLLQLIALGPPVATSEEKLTGTPHVSGPIAILVLALWPVAPRGLLRPLAVACLFVLLPLVSGTLVVSWALGSMLHGFVLAGRQGPIVLGLAWWGWVVKGQQVDNVALHRWLIFIPGELLAASLGSW